MSATVMVVDDDPAIAQLVCLILEEQGIEVVTAPNGAEALEKLSTVHPDVVVLDVEMPVMDGREFFHAMRAGGSMQPVLIVSAHDAHRTQRELGAEAALDKPFDPETLAKRVAGLAGES